MQKNNFDQKALKNYKEDIDNSIKIFKENFLKNNCLKLFDVNLSEKKYTLSVSGGADSIALFVNFLLLAKEKNIEFDVINFDHGIRGFSSQLDSYFVDKICKTFGISCTVCKLNLKENYKNYNKEELARQLRHEEYKKIKNIVVLAHNKQDNVDTILMNIFRGTGLKGLEGIKENINNIYRPMLNIERKQIEEYIIKNNIPFRHDETNSNIEISRNYVRKKIRPIIESKWEKSSDSILRLSKISKEVNSLINNITLDFFKIENSEIKINFNLIKDKFKDKDNFKTVFINTAINSLNKEYNMKDLSMSKLNLLYKLVFLKNGSTLDLGTNIIAIKEREYIKLRKKNKIREYKEKFSLNTKLLEIEILDKSKILNLKDGNIYIDIDKIDETYIIENRKKSDVFIRFSGSKISLSDYLIKKKINKYDKDKLIYIKSLGYVKAIIPLEVSKDLKVDENTKTVLKINLKKVET